MVPLAIFLAIWLVLILINGILTLVTLGQFFKYATPGPLAYGYATIFIGFMIAAILGCGSYFINVDWDQKINFIPTSIQSIITGSGVAQDTPLEQ